MNYSKIFKGLSLSYSSILLTQSFSINIRLTPKKLIAHNHASNDKYNMSKNTADDFFNDIDYPSIIDTIKGIYTSDGSINTLIDFERVLDESDLYAFKNWILGELVDGPIVNKYTVACIFMYPEKLMPNPKGGKRLTHLGCKIHFKKTTIEVPIKLESNDDFKPGTHYPKMIEKNVWLVRIEIPKELMNDIREGTIDLAGQTLDLDELDDAYDEDLDKEGAEGGGKETETEQGAALDSPMAGGQQMPGAM